jgi:hypothetical protein
MLRGMKFQPDSLRTYGSRFRSSVTMYREFLEDPKAWKPPRAKAPAKAKTEGTAKQPTPTGSSTPSLATMATAPGMIPYPFPLREGVLATVYLPANLTKKEAKRLSVFIESLALEEPAQQLALPRGDDASAA